MTTRERLDEALKLLADALDLFHGTHELCDEYDTPEWVWRWEVKYLLDNAGTPANDPEQQEAA